MRWLHGAVGNHAVANLFQPGAEQTHALTSVPPIVGRAVGGAGQPLPAQTRAGMESFFHESLDGVRVHVDGQAAQSARAVDAMAYAAGEHLVFGAGRYAPDTDEGLALLAHELGHVVEQRHTGGATPRAGGDGPTTIHRAPLPGAAQRPNLFAASIPSPTVTRIGDGIVATFYFGHDHFLLDGQNFEALETVRDQVRVMVEPLVGVEGYASTEGTAKHNLELSENRRRTVIAVLQSKMTGKMTVSGTAHGSSDIAAEESGATPDAIESQRAFNRRVTVVILPSKVASSAKPEEKRAPVDLFPHSVFDPKPESDDERVRRNLKDLPLITPRPQTSFSEEVWKRVDDAVDSVAARIGIPKKLRGPLRDGAHALIEKGAEAALDQALDLAKVSDPKAREALKAAITAAAGSKAIEQSR
jgi:outer membrane protein OmpA-like peptidoglycan-associated protein